MPQDQQFETKFSGSKTVFPSGASRDRQTGKGMFHLIPYVALEALAQLYERGAANHGPNNWRKGMYLSAFLSPMSRHGAKLCDCYVDEDHAAAVMWNAAGFIWTVRQIRDGKLPRSLDDVGYIDALETKEKNDLHANAPRAAAG